MAAILANKIISLFVVMLAGLALVKFKVLKPEHSGILSKLMLYVMMPCVIVTSYQTEITSELKQGLLVSLLAAVIVHALWLLTLRLLKKPLRLTGVETASLCYTNSGNLIIPLLTAMIGKEWVIYTSTFIAVQQLLIWTHGKTLLCGSFDLKALFKNVNLICIAIGLTLFLLQIKIPGAIEDGLETLAGMVGPTGMLVVGLLIGGLKSFKGFLKPRLWFITVLRMFIMPMLTLLVLYALGISGMCANGGTILLVTFMAVCAPAATTITNMCVVYGGDSEYAGSINILTNLLCVLSMPAMVMVFERLIA